MATQLQIRRGTASQIAAFTGAEGEVVVNTTNDSIVVSDGSTAGGFEQARADLNNVSDASLNAALTGNTVSALTITTLTLGSTAITATGAEINILDGVTATAAELNILDGVTSTTAELNILDGVTSTAAELNILDGVTATTAELNYVDGVTSAIQTQIDAKAPLASPTFTGTVTVPGLISQATANSYLAGAAQIKSLAGDISYITNVGGNFLISNSSTTDQFVLSSAGNLLVSGGTVSASGLLSVAVGNTSGGALVAQDTNGAKMEVQAAGGLGYVGTTSNHSVLFLTNNAEAFRITAARDMYFGSSSGNQADVGHIMQANGVLYNTADGSAPLRIRRNTSDGDIFKLSKDAAVVGSIGSISGVVSYIVLDPRSSVKGAGIAGASNSASEGIINPTDRTGAFADAAISLGGSSTRWKDLYLSGGAYLGGTAAANRLDSYEEGTFQMTMTGVSGNVGYGKYVKIGSLVHWQFYSGAVVVAGSGAATLTGLPFATTSSPSCYTTFNTAHNTYSGTATTGYLQSGGVNAYITAPNTTSSAPLVAGNPKYIMASGTYYTDL